MCQIPQLCCTNTHCSENAKVLRLKTFHYNISLIFYVWISSDLSHTRHNANKFCSVIVCMQTAVSITTPSHYHYKNGNCSNSAILLTNHYPCRIPPL